MSKHKVDVKVHRDCCLNGCGCLGCRTIPLIIGILVVTICLLIGGAT